MLSRIIYGARISLTIGLLGITISFLLGIVIGGLAGYYGGLSIWWCNASSKCCSRYQHTAVAGAGGDPAGHLEPDSDLFRHHGHTRTARLDRAGARGALQALVPAGGRLRAGRPAHGGQASRIIGRHLVPGFMSHLIATATITIPTMVLGETALSFLGLGLRPPITSWGVLLAEAQNINAVALYPVAVAACCAGDPGDPGLQLPRRWPARRGRSLQITPIDSWTCQCARKVLLTNAALSAV